MKIGKWLPYEFGDYHWHKCSVCGKADKYIETVKRDNYAPFDSIARRRYCPACGAKMEEEDETMKINKDSLTKVLMQFIEQGYTVTYEDNSYILKRQTPLSAGGWVNNDRYETEIITIKTESSVPGELVVILEHNNEHIVLYNGSIKLLYNLFKTMVDEDEN